jgi:urease accessory protein
MQKKYFTVMTGWMMALLPALAYAHSEHEAKSFMGGLLHPLLGTDHLLAMLSVGIISALIGGSAVFWVPGAFVAFMLIGGIIGVLGVVLPHIEIGIAVSVLFLGAGVAVPRQSPIWLTMGVVGLFGSLHGNAHGVEMPSAAVPAFYTFGFIACTALIHMIGVGIGYIPQLHSRNRLPMGVVGLAISTMGLFFLLKQGMPTYFVSMLGTPQ